MADDDGVYREIRRSERELGGVILPEKQIGVADAWCAYTDMEGFTAYFPPRGGVHQIPVWTVSGWDRDALIAVGWPHEGYLGMEPVTGLIID
jgi:hypothetical protein